MNIRASVFIGSSVEQIDLANAIQENLHHDFDTTVWNQSIFGPSEYPLESLCGQLRRSDAGVFVLAPEDLVEVRGRSYIVPRDNVIFELGLFIGGLGRSRSFLVVPRNVPCLKLPTDLIGLGSVMYNPDRTDDNKVAALGPACNQIRKALQAALAAGTMRVEISLDYGLFPEFSSIFPKLISTAKDMCTCFIHSRRWRENNHDHILHFLGRSETKMRVFLPDLCSDGMIAQVADHFDDAQFIPSLIADAYRYYGQLSTTYPSKVVICLFSRYPTYSFYLFDKRIVFALYPNSTIRKGVPSFVIDLRGKLGEFFDVDIDHLTKESKEVNAEELSELASSVQNAATSTED